VSRDPHTTFSASEQAISEDPARAEGERFVAAFQRFWTAPKLEELNLLLHPDVTLVQPLSRPLHGLPHAQAEFARIFAVLPDLTADVEHWAVSGNTLFIEFRMKGTLWGRPVAWAAVDRFTLLRRLGARSASAISIRLRSCAKSRAILVCG
jgi:hypothetical protein